MLVQSQTGGGSLAGTEAPKSCRSEAPGAHGAGVPGSRWKSPFSSLLASHLHHLAEIQPPLYWQWLLTVMTWDTRRGTDASQRQEELVRPSAPGVGQLRVTSSGPVVTLSLKTRKMPFTCTCVSMDNAKNPIPSVSISCAGTLQVSREWATPKSLRWPRYPHVKAHGQR